jgi:hypothetical protein
LEKELYAWARISKDGRQAIIWSPDADKFKELVSKGRLPGKVDKDNNVLLDELQPKDMELINSGSSGVLLEWENPWVLRKISQ